MTKRYKITMAYDGTNFAGFQIQPNQRTVQGVLEKAINKKATMYAICFLISFYSSNYRMHTATRLLSTSTNPPPTGTE